MVTTALRATLRIGVLQDLTALPSTATVQAPQSASPQPYLVPVSPSSVRNTHSSMRSSSVSSVTACPFNWNRVEAFMSRPRHASMMTLSAWVLEALPKVS